MYKYYIMGLYITLYFIIMIQYTNSAHWSGWFRIAWYKCFNVSLGKFSPSLRSARLSMNSAHDMRLNVPPQPWRSVLSNIIAQVSV